MPSGHPEVASRASGRQLYPRNILATPLFVAMTRDDVLLAAHFADGITLGCYPIDIHRPDRPGPSGDNLPSGTGKASSMISFVACHFAQHMLTFPIIVLGTF